VTVENVKNYIINANEKIYKKIKKIMNAKTKNTYFCIEYLTAGESGKYY
jgi:hypothetical protein